MNDLSNEFQEECQYFAAAVALEAAQDLPLCKRIMLYRGILPLLPEGSVARAHAEAAAFTLEQADKEQLRLIEIIQNS